MIQETQKVIYSTSLSVNFNTKEKIKIKQGEEKADRKVEERMESKRKEKAMFEGNCGF